jgi:hypothetical protein
MKRILNFRQYLLEQKNTEDQESNKEETDSERRSRIASSIVKNIFGDIEGLDKDLDSLIDDKNEAVKSAGPYKGCGTEAYQLNKKGITVKRFKEIIEGIQNLDDSKKYNADYTRTLGDLEEKRSVIIGLRNRIEIKKQAGNQDKFTDALYLIPQDAKDEDVIIPYQITTTPSLSYYGEKPMNPQGTGIKLPGDTLYNLRDHELPHGKYKMMVEGEPINVGRYEVGTKKIETYHPVKTLKGQNCGMEIHRSSTGAPSPCVGPWSAGCQVFSDIKEYNDFIQKASNQTKNSNRFFYALVELDMADIIDKEKEKNEIASKDKEETKKSQKSDKKKTKEDKKKPETDYSYTMASK